MLPRLMTCATLILACLLSAPAWSDGGPTARVSDVQGGLSVRGDDEDDVSSVDRNDVIREGDTLWTDRDSLAELELARSSWVRLAENTKLETRDLDAAPELRLWSGSIYLDLSDRLRRSLRLDTPAGEVEIYPDSVVRVDVGGDHETRVSVWSGEARVTPEEGSPIRLRTSERAYLDSRVEGPDRFDRDDRDAFDRYHRDRVQYYIDRPLPRELDRDLIGARELYDAGSWVEVERVRYWRPRCPPDWRPYSYGYWSDVSGWGFTWVDYHPWGYVTCHYGRWRYLPVHGWLWYPGHTWGPGWVYWASWGDEYGWAPLDPWERPCYSGSGSFLSVGIIIDFRSWTFCRRDDFYHGRHHWRHRAGYRPLHPGHGLKYDHARFRPFRNPYEEIGIPRHHARGLAVGKDGRPAREQVLEVEKTLPERRKQSIRRRFHVEPDRDRERASREGEVERIQRSPTWTYDPSRVLKGRDADQRLKRPATRPHPAQPGPGRDPGRDEPFKRNRTPAPHPTLPERPAPPRPAPERTRPQEKERGRSETEAQPRSPRSPRQPEAPRPSPPRTPGSRPDMVPPPGKPRFTPPSPGGPRPSRPGTSPANPPRERPAPRKKLP